VKHVYYTSNHSWSTRVRFFYSWAGVLDSPTCAAPTTQNHSPGSLATQKSLGSSLQITTQSGIHTHFTAQTWWWEHPKFSPWVATQQQSSHATLDPSTWTERTGADKQRGMSATHTSNNTMSDGSVPPLYAASQYQLVLRGFHNLRVISFAFFFWWI